jgi:hypothetical protein
MEFNSNNQRPCDVSSGSFSKRKKNYIDWKHGENNPLTVLVEFYQKDLNESLNHVSRNPNTTLRYILRNLKKKIGIGIMYHKMQA